MTLMVANDETQLNETMDKIFQTKLRNQLKNKLIKAKMARDEERRQYLIHHFSKEPKNLPPILDYYQKDKLCDSDIQRIQNRNQKLRKLLKNK